MDRAFRIQQLRQFVVAATNGSFRSAAAATFRSQAAVSTAMRELESQIGGALFEAGRRVRLTPLGETLLPIFRELVAAHDRAFADAIHLARAEGGTVSIAVMPSLADTWLPRLLERFARLHPGVRINAVDEPSTQVRAMVLSGEVDIGVGGVGPDDPKLRIVSIVEDAFGIVAPEGHPLAKRRSAEWLELKGERIIGNATLEAIRDQPSLRWITAEPVLALRNRASLLGSIRGGIGITILPRLACPPDEYGLRFTQLKNPRLTRTVGIIARDGATLLPAAASMEVLAAASLAEFAAEKGAKVLRAANGRRRS